MRTHAPKLLITIAVYAGLLLTNCEKPQEPSTTSSEQSITIKHHLEELKTDIETSELEAEQKKELTHTLDSLITHTKGDYQSNRGFNTQLTRFANQLQSIGFTYANFDNIIRTSEIKLWNAWCLIELVACIEAGGGEACGKMFASCLENCSEVFAQEEKDNKDCTSDCEQVKRVIVEDFHQANFIQDSVRNCSQPLDHNIVKRAFINKAKDTYGYDWKDDPANTCGKNCHCHGTGNGRLTASKSITFTLQVRIIDSCYVYGRITLPVDKYRRSAECMPNG